MDGTTTWRQLVDAARARLAGGDLRWIVEEVTGCEPGEYHTQLERPATVRAVARFDAMVERRSAGEPLQYVLGRWAFRRLDLLVDRRVLIPRPETETVVDVALVEIDRLVEAHGTDYQHRLPVVDLGTGSGAIALAVADERKLTDVWATDASPEALAVARANLTGIGRAAARVQLRQGSWFAALPTALRGHIGAIVSNPPYVAERDELPPEVADWEPLVALRSGADGLDDARVLIDGALEWLLDDGALVLELAPDQLATAAELAHDAGFTHTAIHPDLAGRQRCLVARRG